MRCFKMKNKPEVVFLTFIYAGGATVRRQTAFCPEGSRDLRSLGNKQTEI